MLNKRQMDILGNFSNKLSALARYFSTKGGAAKAFAFIFAFVQLLGAFFSNLPQVATGENTIDLGNFNLVWSDEFDNGFDTEKWGGHYVYGANDTQLRDVAYWNRKQAEVKDGLLYIHVSYDEEEGRYYSYGMETNPNKHYAEEYVGYEQLYGYFEIRCKLASGKGVNSAFWLLTDGMWADDTDGGVSGCEIDVIETTFDPTENALFGSVYHTIHIDAYGDAHKMEQNGYFYTGNDPYEEFNTYGVEWNPDGYIFYVNGEETARTDFGGVCTVPLYPIISVGVDEHIYENDSLPVSMVVDYVRCYQYK